MAYTKVQWRNNQSPPINADNLNHIEEGIYEAHQTMAENTQNIESLTTQTGANTSAIALEKTQRQQAITTEMLAREQADTLLTNRMDTFTRLPDGSTSGDAELIDIRNGANDIIYPQAGDAVRGQYSELKSVLTKLDEGLYKEEIIYDSSKFTQGVWNDNTFFQPTQLNRIASQAIKVTQGDYCIYGKGDMTAGQIAWKLFSAPPDAFTQTPIYADPAWIPLPDNPVKFVFPESGYAVCNVRYSNDANLSPSDFDALVKLYVDCEYGLAEKIDEYIDGYTLDEFAFDNSYFEQGYIDANSTISNSSLDLHAKRIRIKDAIPVRAGDIVSYTGGGNKQIAFKVFEKGIGVAQTALEQTNWLTAFGEVLIEHSGWLTVNIRTSNDAVISPSDYSGEVTVKRATVVSEVIADDMANEASITFTKGILAATGEIYTSENGVVTGLIPNPIKLKVSGICRVVICLYRGSTYIGKINSSGQMDNVPNDWLFLSAGIYDISHYLIDNGATHAVFCALPTDNLTVVTAETAQSIGETYISCFSSKFEYRKSSILEYDASLKWTNTVYNYGDGRFSWLQNRIGMEEVMQAESDLSVSVASGYKYAIFLFSSATPSQATELSNTGWTTNDAVIFKGQYFIINMAKTDDSMLTPTQTNVNAISIKAKYLYENDLRENATITFTKGSFTAVGVIDSSGNGAVSSVVRNPQSFVINGNARAVLALYKGVTYLGKINSSNQLDKVSGDWKWFTAGTKYDVINYLNTYGADSILVCALPTNGDIITTETVQIWGEAHCEIAKQKYALLDYVDATFEKKKPLNPTNYVVRTDLLKKGVNVDYLGQLTYLQAFCIYNGNYYSINGTNISVQDGSFNETDSATLDTGHGNGLQLGNSKYAYASGWNDNKIYKVDLDNLVVDSVITLPTTGYTTGVVDEVKNLAYIFQRDSYPDHEDNYNFIVYNLTNQQIVSTKKILAYGAMQAADFFNDRIIVLNGLGTSACPNGYRVFDTNGNILADYYLGDFSTNEPEGVCIDRDNHELYISFVDRKVYKITA